MKKALIIGASGFVGEYLAEELVENEIEVYGADIREGLTNIYRFINLNILAKDDVVKILRDVKPDYIINLAAVSSVKLSWQNPTLTFDVNVKGVINIFEAIRRLQLDCRVLLIGSSEEYGITNDSGSINESMGLNALNPYGISKITQEHIALMYKETYGIDVILVRAFNHIGPNQQLGFAIPDFANQIAQIEKSGLEQVIYVGNLKAERDFTDVRDIVKGYRRLLERGTIGEIYNIGSGEVYSIENLLNKLISLSQKDIRVEVDQKKFRPTETPSIVCDNSKVTKSVGWQPEISIDKTLEDILNYWRNKVENA